MFAGNVFFQFVLARLRQKNPHPKFFVSRHRRVVRREVARTHHPGLDDWWAELVSTFFCFKNQVSWRGSHFCFKQNHVWRAFWEMRLASTFSQKGMTSTIYLGQVSPHCQSPWVRKKWPELSFWYANATARSLANSSKSTTWMECGTQKKPMRSWCFWEISRVSGGSPTQMTKNHDLIPCHPILRWTTTGNTLVTAAWFEILSYNIISVTAEVFFSNWTCIFLTFDHLMCNYFYPHIMVIVCYNHV